MIKCELLIRIQFNLNVFTMGILRHTEHMMKAAQLIMKY